MAILDYRIKRIGEGADQVRIFTLEPLGERLEHLPGQFVMLHALDGEGKTLDKRPYSIASAPSSRELEFCIKMAGGKFTSRLGAMKEGEALGVEGPMGTFHYGGEKDAVFIAGGTGIAPLIGMLRHIAAKKAKGRFTLLYSVRNRESVIYPGELERLAKANPSIRVVITLTREEPAGWKGECGRIGGEMLGKYVKDFTKPRYYLCGPLVMVTALRDCLLGMGAKQENVLFEGWG